MPAWPLESPNEWGYWNVSSVGNLIKEFWEQLTSALEDLGDWLIYVFDPNSGPWPKVLAGMVLFALVFLTVARASKVK